MFQSRRPYGVGDRSMEFSKMLPFARTLFDAGKKLLGDFGYNEEVTQYFMTFINQLYTLIEEKNYFKASELFNNFFVENRDSQFFVQHSIWLSFFWPGLSILSNYIRGLTHQFRGPEEGMSSAINLLSLMQLFGDLTQSINNDPYTLEPFEYENVDQYTVDDQFSSFFILDEIANQVVNIARPSKDECDCASAPKESEEESTGGSKDETLATIEEGDDEGGEDEEKADEQVDVPEGYDGYTPKTFAIKVMKTISSLYKMYTYYGREDLQDSSITTLSSAQQALELLMTNISSSMDNITYMFNKVFQGSSSYPSYQVERLAQYLKDNIVRIYDNLEGLGASDSNSGLRALIIYQETLELMINQLKDTDSISVFPV